MGAEISDRADNVQGFTDSSAPISLTTVSQNIDLTPYYGKFVTVVPCSGKLWMRLSSSAVQTVTSSNGKPVEYPKEESFRVSSPNGRLAIIADSGTINVLVYVSSH